MIKKNQHLFLKTTISTQKKRDPNFSLCHKVVWKSFAALLLWMTSFSVSTAAQPNCTHLFHLLRWWQTIAGPSYVFQVRALQFRPHLKLTCDASKLSDNSLATVMLKAVLCLRTLVQLTLAGGAHSSTHCLFRRRLTVQSLHRSAATPERLLEFGARCIWLLLLLLLFEKQSRRVWHLAEYSD